jgi:hypothetical protein
VLKRAGRPSLELRGPISRNRRRLFVVRPAMATVILIANLALLAAMAFAVGLAARVGVARDRLPRVQVAPPLAVPLAGGNQALPSQKSAA